MKRFILSFLILVSSSSVFSQKQYFIYLQAEPEQAFFLKMNEKIHSSTASGYLILSRLRDSSYSFSIGFPQNKWPEQKFVIDIKGKDHGYLLKNFGENGWGLFDLQTMTIQMSLPVSSSGAIKTETKEVSAFTEILSKAANDPSLKERPVAVKMEEKSVVAVNAVLKEEVKPLKESLGVKQDIPPAVNKADTLLTKQDPQILKNDQWVAVNKEDTPVVIKEESITKKEEIKSVSPSEYKKSVVTKRAESSTSEGFGLVFIDDYGNGKKDTVRIIIPNSPKSLAEIKESPKEGKKFLDLTSDDTVKQNEPEIKGVKTATDKPITKTICSSDASESDFLKLRKKMAAENDDEGMVAEAKKYFKSKCFAVSQIKNLSPLFLNDAGKYKFFDAAYLFVSDKENFPSLSAELKDEYYITRFKAMLH